MHTFQTSPNSVILTFFFFFFLCYNFTTTFAQCVRLFWFLKQLIFICSNRCLSVVVTTTKLKCGTTSSAVVCSRCWAISTTFAPWSFTKYIHGSFQHPTIKRYVSGIGKVENVLVCWRDTTTTSCVLRFIPPMIWSCQPVWIKQFVCGIRVDWGKRR